LDDDDRTTTRRRPDDDRRRHDDDRTTIAGAVARSGPDARPGRGARARLVPPP
jgi:hypothetical protein